MKKVRITQIKSAIRVLPEHRANLAALGLTGVNKTREHNLTPAIQGMINRVNHLIQVEEI
ncbi:MAG: 50S ribosomal protein L30 [Fibrobacter sp.]|jgi:large subunit ribosomal protein L30|nr:50S ribosomal protein L30 [Fibrobacter sp.]